MVNYKKLVPKEITNRNSLAGTKCPLSVENLMLLGHFEVHFSSWGRVAKMVNYRKSFQKAITKRNALVGTE